MKNSTRYCSPSGVAGMVVMVLAISLAGCAMEQDGLTVEAEALEAEALEAEALEAEALEAEALEAEALEAKALEAEASVEFASCGQNASAWVSRVVENAAYTGANQRSGSSTSCAAVGVLQPTDDVWYFCYTATSSYTWTFLLNLRTGVFGWVRDDLLRYYGSHIRCSL